jgi:hypothetical protein
MTFAIYKLTPLPAAVCATILFISRNSRRATFGGARPPQSASRESSRIRSIRRPGIRQTTILNGRKGGFSNSTRSFLSPRVQASSRASTRASPESSILAPCSSCSLEFGIAMLLIPLWVGRNTGSSARGRSSTRRFTLELCSRPSRYCTQGWSLISCGVSSAAMLLRHAAHWRTSTSFQQWARTCSP